MMRITIVATTTSTSRHLSSRLAEEGYEVENIDYKKLSTDQAIIGTADLVVIDSILDIKKCLHIMATLKDSQPRLRGEEIPVVLYAEEQISKELRVTLLDSGISDCIAADGDYADVFRRIGLYKQAFEVRKENEELQHEYRQSVETLLDTQRKLTSILGIVDEGIFGLNEDGEHIFVNPGAAKLLGYTPEELIGQNSHLTWHYKHLDGSVYPDTECPIQKTLHAGIPYRGEDYFIRKDGSLFLAEFSSVPQHDESGINGCVVSFWDITERRGTEKILNSIYDTIPLSVCLVDRDRRILFANRALYELTMTSPGALTGGTACGAFGCVNASEDPQGCGFGDECADCTLKQAMEETFASGAAQYNVEKSFTLVKDGERREVVVLGNTALTQSEMEPQLVLSLQDITASRKQENEMGILRQAIEQSQVSTVITDAAGSIEYVNPAFEAATGYTAAEAVGQNPRILKAGDRPDSEYKELWETISSGRQWAGQFHNRRKNGELYWEQALISPVHDNKGAIRQYLAHKLDVTRQKQLEEQLDTRLRYERLVSRISSEALTATDAGRFLGTCADLLGSTVAVSRTYFIEYQEESGLLRNTVEWCHGETPSQKEALQAVPSASLSPFIEELKSGHPLRFDDIEGMAESELKTILRNGKVLSLLNYPIFVDGKFHGVLGYDTCLHSRSWSDDDVAYLSTLSTIISITLTRLKHEATLRRTQQVLEKRLKEIRIHQHEIFLAFEKNVPLDDIYQVMVEILPSGFQYPEITCAELVLYGKRYVSNGFQSTPLVLSHEISVSGKPIGLLTVGCLEERQEEDESPFLEEEAVMIGTVAVRLGHRILGRKMEEQLRLQSQAMDSTDVFIMICDAITEDYPIVYVNSAFEKFTGYSTSEVMGENPRFLQGTDTDQPGLAIIRKGLKEGEPCRTLIRNYRADGRLFWNEINISPVRDESGRLTHFIGVANDITELKKVQINLVENERRLRTSQEFANIGTWEWNLQTGALFWSERIGPLFGYPIGELETTYENFLSAIHPDDRAAVVAAIENTLKTGDVYKIEHRCCWPDGTIRWLSENGNVEFDDDGGPLRMLGLVSDITDRKTAEHHLHEAEERLSFAIESAKDGIWDWDLKTGSMIFSRLYMEMLGYRDNELPSHVDTWRNSVHPDDLDRATESLTAYLNGKTESYQPELRLRCKDGSYKWILCRGAVVSRDREGKPDRMIGIHSDISLRKENETLLLKSLEAADKANRAKSEFLASMSHELRTPMNAILGFGQLIAMDKDLATLHQEWIQEILKAGQHLLSLISEVLDLARIESGKIDFEPEAVESSEVIRECLAMVSPHAHRFNVSMRYESPGSFSIWTDRTRFKQVLVNLLSNAVKYNRPGGQVTIVSLMSGAMVRFVVQDTGMGIPREKMGQVFTPFNRLGRETGSIEGTGIGLSLSKRLIELMGGQIGFESVVNEGSTFWIELPLSEAASMNKEEGIPAGNDSLEQGAGYGDFKVLYIDDNPSSLKLVESILNGKEPIRLYTSTNSPEGLELAEIHRPDLILLDLNIPGMDGYDVLGQLKSRPWAKSVPVMALTAQAMQNDREKVVEAGFSGHLTKPLDIADFLKMIETALKERGI